MIKVVFFQTFQLLATADEVANMKEELATMSPLLEEAVKESITTMEKITVDTAIAEETKTVVQQEEESATIKATETQAIADDAQRDLNEALPALVCHIDKFCLLEWDWGCRFSEHFGVCNMFVLVFTTPSDKRDL